MSEIPFAEIIREKKLIPELSLRKEELVLGFPFLREKILTWLNGDTVAILKEIWDQNIEVPDFLLALWKIGPVQKRVTALHDNLVKFGRNLQTRRRREVVYYLSVLD